MGDTYSGRYLLSAEDGTRGRYDARYAPGNAYGEAKAFFDDDALAWLAHFAIICRLNPWLTRYLNFSKPAQSTVSSRLGITVFSSAISLCIACGLFKSPQMIVTMAKAEESVPAFNSTYASAAISSIVGVNCPFSRLG